MTIGGEYSDSRRLRQVAAELQRKKDALLEAKYNFLERCAKAEIKKVEAEEEQDPLKKKLKEIQAEKLAAQATMVERPYIGAMKDVVELSKLHDSIVERIKAEYGKADEETFEIDEAKYWVKRSFAQSLRDIRERGCITKGEQELIEQIGLDPLIVDRVLKSYLSEFNNTVNSLKESKQEVGASSSCFESFLNVCADEFYKAASEKLKRISLPESFDKEDLFLLEENTDENL